MRLTATRTKIFTLVLLLSFLCSTFPVLALGIPKVERTTSLLSEAVETQNGYGTEEAYGEHYEVSPTTNQAVADANNFLYTGQQLDKDIGQYYLRARFYDAGLGHFTVRDPIRTQGGINMYAYVNGNPINYNDPSGLHPKGKRAFTLGTAYSKIDEDVGGIDMFIQIKSRAGTTNFGVLDVSAKGRLTNLTYSKGSGLNKSAHGEREVPIYAVDPFDPSKKLNSTEQVYHHTNPVGVRQGLGAVFRYRIPYDATVVDTPIGMKNRFDEIDITIKVDGVVVDFVGGGLKPVFRHKHPHDSTGPAKWIDRIYLDSYSQIDRRFSKVRHF